MNCEKCGRPLEGSGSFCTNCGHAVSYKNQPYQPVQPEPQEPAYQQPVYQEPAYQPPAYQPPVYQPPVQPAYQPYQPYPLAATAAVPEKRENVFTGIVGAVIGAAIGGASIILLSQLGVVAAISGLILAVCTMKGYELLGGKLGTAGIVISIVLMVLTPYFADRIDWAILAMNSLGYDFGYAYQIIPDLVDWGYIEVESYLLNLGLIYLFVIMGAVGTVVTTLKRVKK